MNSGFGSRLTPVVKKLLIINAAVFFLGFLFGDNQVIPGVPFPVSFFEKWFAIFPISVGWSLQLWRIVTYQFLHASFMHVFFNMLGLFFFGPNLERSWGSKRFLMFYLICGAVGGLFYTVLARIGFLHAAPMVGASGAVLGILAACAILFPHVKVFMFPIPLPIPIRIVAAVLIVISITTLISKGQNAGGEAAHLAGMVTGAGYVLTQSSRDKWKTKVDTRLFQRQLKLEQNLKAECDRILKKVHDHGIQSLTPKESRILKKATRAEQSRGTF